MCVPRSEISSVHVRQRWRRVRAAIRDQQLSSTHVQDAKFGDALYGRDISSGARRATARTGVWRPAACLGAFVQGVKAVQRGEARR